MTKKYPIGTKIRFLHQSFDTNKTGEIVGYWMDGGNPVIYLPTAAKHLERRRYPTLSDGTKFTWKCFWVDVELFIQKNQQLEFSFMR